MTGITLAQLRVLQTVVAEGSLQAAAARLGRTHPTLHTALAAIEGQIGVRLFDRSGYRLALTANGHAVLARASRVLAEAEGLDAFARRLAAGEEPELRVVIGDLSPTPEMLRLLRDFFAAHPQTRLHLGFEALSGPWESLLEDRVDLILHHVEHGDARFERLPLGIVELLPVAAPGFLPFPLCEATVDRMRDLTQCVIRDTGKAPGRSYFTIEGAPVCSVADQMMKREVILQGLGWGHLPRHLIEADLREGRLVSFANATFRGGTIELVAARKSGRPHGPIAARLWASLASAGR
jgi:DNA-binding transcriptional LysR family regulator